MTNQTRTIVIAEAGVNHNGDLELALELVDRAAEARVDFVKFQTFKASKLATKAAPKAAYQKATTDADESQLDMLRRLELTPTDHRVLIERCTEKGIDFLSTAFDLDSLAFLADDLGLNTLKLGSGELTNGPILLAAARSGMSLLLSTGMGSLAEVEEALGVIAFGLMHLGTPTGRTDFAEALLHPTAWAALRERVTLLHCTTEYPAAVEDTNLRAIDTMRQAFGLRVGYSDHTRGNAMSIAAVARGASVIEKHFTLDRKMDGPDHAASVEPDELAQLVRDIRAVEAGLGSGIKQPGPAEIRNRPIVRKCVIAARHITAGRTIVPDDLATKRGEGAIPAIALWDCVGRRARRDLAAETAFDWEAMTWAD
ncbi:MAG: N-acetylneuraminate synthase [Rhodobacterales bacterium RIFCSPHIGHO2_02_FULL_62_130]|nr:MAG: N-acetylneuraminate synthase [Rhodobacterales bacterium RIFCSPHIGHO2_02_FULL_62_130]OHC60302.1 MAG: N-acetylneuraminate synthase [Rhodobacterales bacterium RIFCSPHIGHO2_12_FULL_62_75]HCZ01554.1 N-acetylneuraminate synthase [Rhodobacter sp.]